MGFHLGFQAALYFLSTGTRASWGTVGANGIATGALPADLTLAPDVKDVNLPLDGNDVKLTTRGNGGFGSGAAGIIDGTFTISQVYDPDDALWLKLMAALLNRTTQALAILDRLGTVSGATGIWADFAVIKHEKSEPVDEAQMSTWTIRFGYSSIPPQVVQVTGS